MNNRANALHEIDVHQFRIVATGQEGGEPTPEGIHHGDDDLNAIYLTITHQVVHSVNNSVFSARYDGLAHLQNAL